MQLFTQLLTDEGLDLEQLYRDSGLTLRELQRQDAMLKLLPLALSRLEDKRLGLKFGQRMNIPQLGVIGYALMSCATGEAALKLLLQYQRIIMPEVVLSTKQEHSNMVLSCRAEHLTQPVERFCLESFFVAICLCATELLGAPAEHMNYRFAYREPAYSSDYQTFLKGRVEFNCQASQVIIPLKLLQAPLTSANPVLETIYREQCDLLLQQLGTEQAVSARVQQMLLNRRGDFPELKQIAAQLNMSESTLRRRLTAEGSGYQKLLDKVRFHLARQYLQATALPVVEVGRLLGFDDAANFRRAFSRWSGQAPSAFRLSLKSVEAEATS